MADMLVIDHNRAEWSRLAQDAYKKGRNTFGHHFSGAASVPDGYCMPTARFDQLQTIYRAWLLGGFKLVDAEGLSPAATAGLFAVEDLPPAPAKQGENLGLF